MGTETPQHSFSITPAYQPVKLNNPQMGTETWHTLTVRMILKCFTVKLNNPQMGTETREFMSYEFAQDKDGS